MIKKQQLHLEMSHNLRQSRRLWLNLLKMMDI